MPTDKIDLRASLEESPQIQAQISKLEKNIAPMKDCTVLLRDTFQACSRHQLKVCEGTDTMTKLLKSFQEDALSEDDSFLSGSFGHIGRYLNELHSCQDMLSTQLQNAVIELLSQFIANDFSEIDKLKENYESAGQEHEQAIIKYSRISRKKDSEKGRFEANSDLFSIRKKYYESCLDYFTKLNGFKLKWKYSLMEPLLTYMHAQMAYFKAGHEVLNKELGKVLNELNTQVQRFHSQYQTDMASMTEEREEIELTFPTICLPDPDPTNPFIDYHPPKTTISSKNGYLFLRGQQKSGFLYQWDRGYFFTKKGQLFSHFPQKGAESLFLLRGADASMGEVDDRRYVFQVTHPSHKRPFYFMAENELERDEWIATINNNNQERGSHQSNSAEDAEVIKQKREEIRSWVNKEIRPPKPQARPIPRPLRSHTVSAPNAPLINRAVKSKKSDSPSSPYPLTPPQSSLGHLPTPLQPEKVPVVGTISPQPLSPSVGPSKKFSVKYLGHTEIKDGKAPNVISDTIRKVMVARSLQSVKSATDIEMTIASKSIVFMDLGTMKAIGQIQLTGVVRCSPHPDNVKLLGVINRSNADPEKTRYICHVLESELEGTMICKVIDDSVMKSRESLKKSTHSTSQPSMSYSGQPPLMPRRPPPPVFKPTVNSSGYVTFDNDQVIAANVSRSVASTAMKNTISAPSLTDNSSQQRTLPPPPPLSTAPRSTTSSTLNTTSNVSDQGKMPPNRQFSDNFTQDSDHYLPDHDDLPPLDSPSPPPISVHSQSLNSGYISDSNFTLTSSSMFNTTTCHSDYHSNTAASESFDNESVWSSISGQPSTTADSGYYKTDAGVSSIGEPPAPNKDDFDLFQDTFSDSSVPPKSTDLFHSNHQSATFNSSSSASGYYTSPAAPPASSVCSTVPALKSSSFSSLIPSNTTLTSSMGVPSYSATSFPPVSAPSSQTLNTTDTQEEEFDFGETVDLLSDLAEPPDDGSNFQTNFATSMQSTSSGYYQGDQTTPAMSTSTAYFSTNSSMNNGYSPFDSTSGGHIGGEDFGDDWLPPLPDDNDTSFNGSFMNRKT